jgi:hypothetical protein
MGADRTLMQVKVRCGLGRVGVLGRLYGNSRGMSAPGQNRKSSMRANVFRFGDPDIPRSISTLTTTGQSGWPIVVASIHCPFNDSMNTRAGARRAPPSGRIGLNQSR